MGEAVQRPATFREVLAVGEFRVLWAAELQSVAGDQLTRVALLVLVFGRTGSAAWTALTYALTYLPDVVAGPLLGGLADRYPRRAVMVVADLLRAAGVAVMAIPGLPLAMVALVLVAVQLCGAPFASARAALLPLVLAGDRYVVAQAVRQTSYQLAVVVGFAGGGAVVALVGVSWALVVDAATFAISAALIGRGVRPRSAPNVASQGQRWSAHWSRLAAGAVLVWRDGRLRSLVAVSWLAGFTLVAEGLAAPYAAQQGAGAGAVGALLAASAVGAAAGMLSIGRWCPPTWRLRLIGPLAVATTVPLLGFAAVPDLPVAASGACAAYQIPAATTFMRLVPDHQRGQAFGLAGSGLKVAQGVGIAAGGFWPACSARRPWRSRSRRPPDCRWRSWRPLPGTATNCVPRPTMCRHRRALPLQPAHDGHLLTRCVSPSSVHATGAADTLSHLAVTRTRQHRVKWML